MVRPRPSETRDRDRLELAELLASSEQLTGEIVARTQQKRLYTAPALLSRAETRSPACAGSSASWSARSPGC